MTEENTANAITGPELNALDRFLLDLARGKDDPNEFCYYLLLNMLAARYCLMELQIDHHLNDFCEAVERFREAIDSGKAQAELVEMPDLN